MKITKKAEENCAVFVTGAATYSMLEVMARGFTHWTMTITGGVCFLLFHLANARLKTRDIISKCLAGCGIITAVEFAVGCLVNRVLQWDVWDYSAKPGNLLGQICPDNSALWFLLSIPMAVLSTVFSRRFSQK